MQDPYCYENTHVLKNKFNIRDANELQDAERRLTKYRTEELLLKPMRGRFDFKHLQKIHHYLFQDIYDWAGEVRSVDIAKGNLFCRYFAIAGEAERIFGELKAENYLAGLSIQEFSKRLAYYFAEINALHPFGEGNGRTQREFVRQLAYQNDYFLSFKGVTKDTMISASVASFKLEYEPLRELLLEHLQPI
ncbi:Fic family protein [Candidatus Saccharibacteria bacterium]|nr:Fic family protein [Candidatus Saccharibacteria bacterium]